jgi:hypothetical protein
MNDQVIIFSPRRRNWSEKSRPLPFVLSRFYTLL